MTATPADITARTERLREILKAPAQIAAQEPEALALIEAGIDPESRDQDGYTLLHDAASGCWLSAVRALLDAKANVNDNKNLNKATPLHQVSGALFFSPDAAEIIRLLVRHGADVKIGDYRSRVALHFAAASESPHAPAMTEALLESGSSVRARDGENETPVYTASKKGSLAVLSALLDKKPDMRAKNKHGNTFLHGAVMHDRAAIASLLLERGAHIDTKNKNGRTPLHLAAWRGSLSCAELLVDRGADTTVWDNQYCTPERAAHNAILHHSGAAAVEEFLKSSPEERMAKAERLATVRKTEELKAVDTACHTPIVVEFLQPPRLKKKFPRPGGMG